MIQLYDPTQGRGYNHVKDLSVLGLDLGQTGDNAVGAVLTKKRYAADFIGPRWPKITCPAIKRWELGTDYCVIVDNCLDLAPDVIAVEFNGVGRPFVDMLRRQAMLRGYKGVIRPVLTAGSDARTVTRTEQRGQFIIVPKVDLVTAAILLQQDKLLQFAPMPEVQLLLSEMRSFKMRHESHKAQQFGAEPGKHDDIVMAFSIACWYMTRFGQATPAIWCG